MNTYLFQDPHFRPLSLSGAILPGSYVQFYITQTTTPTPVYADAALNTELSNPVVADGDGQFAVMYMDPSVTYRVQLYDAEDELLWDVDPYTPPRDFAPGTVLEFYGTLEQLEAAYPPELWQQLDGNNGAPDGRDRVTLCVGTNAAGDTGGAAITITDAGGDHDHGGATASTVLTSANMPVHNHELYVRTSATLRGNTHGFGFSGTAGVEGQIIDDAPYGYLDEAPQSAGNKLIQETGSSDPDGHDHDISASGTHTHGITGDGLPPWLCLWKIMRRYP